MRSKLVGLCFILTAYVVFLVITLPAKLALSYLPLPPQVVISQVTGTVWHGHAEKVSYDNIDVIDFVWDTSFITMLTGSIEANVQFGRGKSSLRGHGDVGYSSNGGYAKNVTVEANSEWLLMASNIPVPVTTSGEVKLEVSEAQQGQPWCEQLSGKLTWSNAGIQSLIGNIMVDSAVADLSCESGALVANIKQASSQLRLSGIAKLAAENKYSLSAVLVPSNELPESIRTNLRYIGKPNAKGEYQLNYSGRI
ncbi:MAG: general secretion pathway protein N [Moritella sp.]|jgi:general secretion pathway protein N